VRRWLAEDVIKPWHDRSWIFRDPYFAFKAARVLDLYQRIWDGQPLADDRAGPATARRSGPRRRR
jgi:hypothetical protein